MKEGFPCVHKLTPTTHQYMGSKYSSEHTWRQEMILFRFFRETVALVSFELHVYVTVNLFVGHLFPNSSRIYKSTTEFIGKGNKDDSNDILTNICFGFSFLW